MSIAEQHGNIVAIYYQPPSRDVEECVITEVVYGPKRYARLWIATQELEWGWTLHETAVELWRAPE